MKKYDVKQVSRETLEKYVQWVLLNSAEYGYTGFNELGQQVIKEALIKVDPFKNIREMTRIAGGMLLDKNWYDQWDKAHRLISEIDRVGLENINVPGKYDASKVTNERLNELIGFEDVYNLKRELKITPSEYAAEVFDDFLTAIGKIPAEDKRLMVFVNAYDELRKFKSGSGKTATS